MKYVDYSGHESIGEPQSYLERTLDMVILGSYTDEFIWLGLGLQFLLGLTGIDVVCDIRDLTADVTVNRDMTSLSWYGTMLLDIVALVPVIGGMKYLDDLAAGTKSIVKNSDELIDGGKHMARAADALHDLSKKGRTVLNDMADTLRGMPKKVVKNADILNDAKYTDELANVASDAGKRLDDLAGGGLDANLLNDMGIFTDDMLENNYQVYVNRKIKKGQTPKSRLDWKKASDYWTKESSVARGNNFNKTVRGANIYDYHEIYLENGKRLDSYDPNTGEIISRKATDLDKISLETYKEYLSDFSQKYSEGTRIRSNAYPELDGQELKGQYILEIPANNASISNIDYYKQIAAEYDVILRFTEEVQ